MTNYSSNLVEHPDGATPLDPDVLSEAFVCELHRKLFGSVWKWAGTFRHTEKILV